MTVSVNPKIYSYEKNKLRYKKYFYSDYLKDGVPHVEVLDHGVILPIKRIEGQECGGVLDEECKFFTGLTRDGSYSSSRPTMFGEVRTAYSLKEEEIFNSNEQVIFGGVLIGHFGHMITEGVARLWWIIENSSNKDKIVFITAGSGFKDYMYEILDLCNIPRNRIIILQRPTRFSRIIVPEQALFMGRSYYSSWTIAHKCMMKNALSRIKNTKLPKKIYLTKRFYEDAANKTANEEYFESFYKNKGFEVIIPEFLSVTEKVAIVANADEMAAVSGTPALFSLFMRDGATANLLIKNEDYLSSANIIGSLANNLHLNIVDVGLSFLPHLDVHGVFFLGATLCWKQYVIEHYGKWEQNYEMISDTYQKYIKIWADFYYKQTDRFRHDKIDYRDGFDILKKLSLILYDVDLLRTDYSCHDEISNIIKK